MNSKLYNIFIVLICLATLSIFLLPFASVFSVDGEGKLGRWRPFYLIEDLKTLLFYLPFVMLWGLFLARKRLLNSNSFKIMLVLSAFISFTVSFLYSSLLTQDFEPLYGVLISIMLFPLLILFLTNNRVWAKQKRNAS